MMRGIETLYFRNPRLLLLTVAVIVVGGLSAYAVLPRAEDPTLARRFGTVFTRYPGASAERVEALVTEKLEDELQEIEEIKILESTSRFGISVINMELRDDISPAELDPIWSRVRDQISEAEAQLPERTLKPELEQHTIHAYTLVYALRWMQDEEPPYAILRRVARTLEDALRVVPGTAEVDLYGDPDEEIRVSVNAEDLAALQLTVDDVAQAIRRADVKIPAGQLSQRETDLMVEVAGEIDSLQRVLEIPIRQGPDGQLVRVGDVARVTKSIVEPPSDLAIVSGRPAVVLATRVEEDQRVDLWAADARAAAERFRQQLPRGLALTTVFDQSQYVSDRLDGLARNLLAAMGLVTLVIFFMMGWRSALTVGVALPLTSLMVLMWMRALGIPLHQMSVTGLIVALGLLIDNAIVMVDEVRKRLEDGLSPADAITRAVRHLAVPLFGSTFTTALAFLPIVLMPGGAGEFVGSIGVSVILAISSSLFLSLTVTAALTGLMRRLRPIRALGGVAASGFSSDRLNAGYRRFLGLIMARPALGIALAAMLPIAGFVQSRHLAEQFFPPAERNQFQIEFRLPTHASLQHTKDQVLAARDLLLDHPEVRDVHWFVGTSAPRFYYNMFGFEDDAAYYAQALVEIERAANCVAVIRDLQRELDRAFPQAMAIGRQFEQGPPFDAPVELRVYGPDLDVLRQIGERVRAELSAIPETVHTRATLDTGQAKLWVSLNEDEARRAGLDNVGIANTLRGNLSGAVGGSLMEATEELPIRVRLAEDRRADVADVASIDLVARRGVSRNMGHANLPLTAVGQLELQPEIASIAHRDGVRVNTVQGFIQAGVLPSKVLAALQERLDRGDFSLPPGYRLAVGGEAAERDNAVANLMASVGVIAVIMAATLVLTFSSFRLAALLAATAGLAVGLGLAALWLFGYPFGFMAIVGTMGLIGVAMNDSIVVLAAIREDEQARGGDRGAIARVVFRATRHVLSTTTTTLAGFTPLIVAGGGFWPPLAVVIGGGVVGATLLALVFVPAGYSLLMGRRVPAPRPANASTDDRASGRVAIFA
jgi:multidrug efflux pump subunit AcrB